MIKAFSSLALAASFAVMPLAYQPDVFELFTKFEFDSAPLSYYIGAGHWWSNSFNSNSDGLGLFYISSDLVYSSVDEFPRDVPDDFTAFLVSGGVPLPEISDSRILSSRPALSYLPNASQGVQGVPEDSESSSYARLVALRCVYYKGSVVPASAPCPLFVADSAVIAGNSGNYSVAFYYQEGVSYPVFQSGGIGWSTSAHFDSYLVPCLPNSVDFVPVNPDINGDDTITTLYRFGQLLAGDAQNASSFLNFKIFGYPLYQVLLTTGFYLVAGWTLLRFVIP